MPIYEIDAPNGKTYEIEGPAGASKEQLVQVLLQKVPYAGRTTEQLKEEKSAPFSASNLGLESLTAGAGGIKALTDVFGTGNAASKALEGFQQRQMSSISPERMEEMRRREEIKSRAKTTGEEIAAYVGGFTEAPLTTTTGVLFSSLPVIAGGLVPGGAAASLAARGAQAAPLLTRAQAVQTGIGGLMGLGGQKGQEYQAVRDALIAKDVPEQEADRIAQQVSSYGLESLPRNLAALVAGSLEGRFGAESVVSNALTKRNLSRGATSVPTSTQAALSSIVGETAPEALQAGVSTVGTNLALNQAGVPTDLTQGLAGSVAHDALVGATLGLAVSPAQKANLIREFEKGRADEDLKRRQEFEQELADRNAKAEQERAAKIKANEELGELLGVNRKVLALPAPAKEARTEEDVLQEPLGRVTREELAPEVTKYIDTYRKDNGLPRLKDFSIEDVRDAMTQVNPEGERAALDSIITAKTSYTGNESYTPDDVLNAAARANVAPETKGFRDFLARTTGESDLNNMSPPQLYAAFSALDRMGDRTNEKQTVLPEGSNATRYTQKQYDNAVKFVNASLAEAGGPLGRDQIVTDIKDSTNLETDRDAETILNNAIKNGDLSQTEERVYRTVDPETGAVKFTYRDKAQAEKAAAKQGLNVQDTTLRQIATKESPTTPRQVLPAGYELEEQTLEAGQGPAEIGIFPEGKGKKLTSLPTMVGIEEKISRLKGLRQKEAAKILKDVEKYDASIASAKQNLESMEARGEEGTEAYKKAQARLARVEDILARRRTALFDRMEEMDLPLVAKPVGTKQATRKVVNVKKDGKVVGTYPDRATAIESVLPTMSDAELEELSVKGGATGDRAAKAMEERKAPGQRIKGTKEGLERAGVETTEFKQKLKDLEDKLVPMLTKFGLKDVALKVVREIEKGAEGSYSAKLIKIALDAENPITTMRHEAIHALKELGFFTPQQWAALEKRAKDEWIDKYLGGENAEVDGEVMTRLAAYKKMGLSEAEIIEEAIADAFGSYVAGTKPPAGLIQALFNKLNEFFKALRSSLTGANFESAEEIFGKIEEGKLEAVKDVEGKQGLPSGRKLSLVTLDTRVGPNGKTYSSEYVEPILDAVAKGNYKPITLNDGTKINLVLGKDKSDNTRGKVVAVDQNDNFVGHISFYKSEGEDGNRFGPDVNVLQSLRRKGLATALYDFAEANGALIPDVNQPKQFRTEEGQAFRESRENAWKASKQTIEAADKYEEENGIKPYVSEGFLDFPTDGTKYSLQKYNPEKHLSFDATLGVPINKDGLITLYYHTTKEKAVQIGNKKIIPSEGRNRVYLTNESNGADVIKNRGNFDQEFDGSTVLVYVHPDMLQVDDVQENGRRDFFIPLAQGDFFNKKMKLQSIQKSRTSPITEVFNYNEHEKKIADAVKAYKNATPAERRKLVSSARKVLKQEHNVGSLLSENGKLEKTRVNEYDLDWEGNSVASMGLGLASAQQISEKVSTCPRSAICEGLCLGETSGGNFMFGGAASEDVGDIKKSSFRAAARMMQYLKTEALIIHPEEFAMVLQAEIDSLAKWSASETQNKRNKETGKNEKIEKEIYQPAIRLNVTSDFKPTMFRAIIEANPDTRFYDYTKLGSESIAPNHHLTYSSTGFGQVVNGEKVFFKDKSGKYDHNWATMRSRLNDGQNVAMAFSSKSGIPSFLVDEETNTQYRVWNGDDYDARFLDPKQPDGKGMIIGLKNKAGNLSEKNATQKTGGFFVQYDPKTDGDTVVVPNQRQFKGLKDISVATTKYSLRAAPDTPEFKQWFGNSKIVNKDGTPKVMYHGLGKDTKSFERKTARGAPVFLTDNPDVATLFANDSYTEVAKNPKAYLTDKQMKEGVREAIAAIRKDYGKDSLGKEMIASIKDGKIENATPEAKDYIRNAFVKMLPTGPHIMPLYVKAENPFDYENPSHITRLKEEVSLDNDIWTSISNGDWDAIEAAEVQEAIKMAGFDSFYTKELGTKNIAVYEPTQVKSATGNIGTYDSTNPDVRYSLRTHFPDAKSTKEAVKDVTAPDTKEFKQFFRSSQFVNKDGDPRVMYHGTSRYIDEFQPKQADAIFITDNLDFAEEFSKTSAGYIRKEIYAALTKPEKVEFFDRVFSKMVADGELTEAEAKQFMSDVKRKAPDYGKFFNKKAIETVEKELLALSPSQPNIMPLWVSAQNVFDYENPKHVQHVIDWISQNVDLGHMDFPEKWLAGRKGSISRGLWNVIETPSVQKAIRALGFDGFSMKEGKDKNYGVYSPAQVKSATGNIGTFNLDNNKIRYSLRSAADKFETQSIKDVAVPKYKSKDKLVEMRISDFLDLAEQGFDQSKQDDADRIVLSDEKLMKIPEMNVWGSGNTYDVMGHEGRHRARALLKAGYDTMPVLLKNTPIRWSEQMDPESFDYKKEWPKTLKSEKGALKGWFSIDFPVTREESPKSYSPEIKFSLKKMPQVGKGIDGRVNEVTYAREEKGFFARMSEAIGPRSADYFRQKALNRYNQLSNIDRLAAEAMGGVKLLADASAEAMALMSDLSSGVTASVLGYGDRHGGIPVLRNGATTVDRSTKGLIAILEPIARYNDPKVYQYLQFVMAEKRGQRLNDKGIEVPFTKTDKDIANELKEKFPEFKTFMEEYNKFNDGLVKYLVDTGVLTKEKGEEFKKYADYVPFYRQMEGERTIGPNVFSSISGVKGPKAIKGGEGPLADFLETMVRNTQSAISMGMKNTASQVAAKNAVTAKVAERVVAESGKDLIMTGAEYFQVLEGGKQVSYRTYDALLIDSLSSLHMPDLPFMGILSAPSNWLRNLVTKDPAFMMANLMRDSLSAYVTSGEKLTPVVSTVSGFFEALRGKSKGFDALMDAGVIGGYEFSANVESSGRSLQQDLEKKFGQTKGIKAKVLRTAESLWDGLEKGTTASDAATRAKVYEQVLAETGNEAEALYRSLEIMNFNRKGNSALVRIVTASIPFLNARMQGLDVFYRAGIAPTWRQLAYGIKPTEAQKNIQRAFFTRGMMLMSLSLMYYAMVHDDEEWKSQEQETRDNNWIIPSAGLKIPIPFEVGVLFKVIPERIAALALGNDTGEEFLSSMQRNLVNTLGFTPMPQTAKPLFEVATNYSFFTGRKIIGQGMEDVESEYQVAPNTSRIAESIGKAIGASPIKVDHVIKGYTGSIGMYAIDIIDSILGLNSDETKAAKRFEQMPIIKRFAADPEARGNVTAYYELKDASDKFARTMNLLERTGDPKEFAKYVNENKGLFATRDYVLDLEKSMKEMREMRAMVQSAPLSPTDKRDTLIEIGRMESNLTANIKDVRKLISSVQ